MNIANAKKMKLGVRMIPSRFHFDSWIGIFLIPIGLILIPINPVFDLFIGIILEPILYLPGVGDLWIHI